MSRTYRGLLTLGLAAVWVTAASAQKPKATSAPAQPAATAQDQNITAALNEAYAKFKGLQEGKNADYIPALAKVDPNIFGIALVTTDGKV